MLSLWMLLGLRASEAVSKYRVSYMWEATVVLILRGGRVYILSYYFIYQRENNGV